MSLAERARCVRDWDAWLFGEVWERPLLKSMNGCNGSIAPIRFLKQRPFDQRFARLGSPNFERLLCRVFHCACDDEQRLLCFETGHSRREFFCGMNGRRWPNCDIHETSTGEFFA